MQAIYYCNKWMLVTLVPITNDWRDDVASFRFIGPTWCQWLIPGTFQP